MFTCWKRNFYLSNFLWQGFFENQPSFFPIPINEIWKIFVWKILELTLGLNSFEKLCFFSKSDDWLIQKLVTRMLKFWCTLNGTLDRYKNQFDPLQYCENHCYKKTKILRSLSKYERKKILENGPKVFWQFWKWIIYFSNVVFKVDQNFAIAFTWKMRHFEWLKIDSKWSFLL